MAKRFNNSLSNSLKGKIWLATTALAFFICVFGIISYLIASSLINDTFYSVAIPFLLLSVTVAIFGWWVANEVVNPVEKVLLLSKSLERGVSTSLPKSSGSTETDELMETIFRLSQQTQKLINSMEEVSQGHFETSLNQNPNSDRLTLTFQKLLAKVSESIYAKQDLEKLQKAVDQLAADVFPLGQDKLNVLINSNDSTEEISGIFNHLIEQLKEIILQVKNSTVKTQTASVETQRNINEVIEQDDNRIQKLQQASLQLKQVPQTVRKISEELSHSVFSAHQSIEKAKKGNGAAQANLNAITQLRQQIYESIKQMQKLNESSQELGKVAKTVEDLAQRTSMVALNASIQAAEINENGRGFVVVAEEVERLAERAHNTNKNISSLNKSIQAEIGKVENLLETTVSEVANLSKFAIESGNSLGELERYVTQFLNLQEKIVAFTQTQTEDTEAAFEIFVESISGTQKSVVNLKEASQTIQTITERMAKLEDSVSHFEIASLVEENRMRQISLTDFSTLMEQNISA
jgi:methyl-accepting chemotaxis protein